MSSESYCIPNHSAGVHKVLLVLAKVWSAALPGVEKQPRGKGAVPLFRQPSPVGRGAVVSYE